MQNARNFSVSIFVSGPGAKIRWSESSANCKTPYILNSYQFKISIYCGTFSDCDLFRCHCHPSFLNISNCSAALRPSNRATFVEDLYFCMHRIELHSVTVIGCAQNKAKYCTRQCYCTSCTNTQHFKRSFVLLWMLWNCLCLHHHAQIAGLLQRRSQTLKLDVKLGIFGTALRVNNVTDGTQHT